MGLFPLFKKKAFFSVAEDAQIIDAIRKAERETSGEIRVYVETKNPLVDTLERAKEIFLQLNMQNTAERNAVLLYIATKHRELALYGDKGIYEKTGHDYWNDAVKKMIAEFKNDNVCDAIVHCIGQIGQTLKEKFPYDGVTDKNELSDDIMYGE